MHGPLPKILLKSPPCVHGYNASLSHVEIMLTGGVIVTNIFSERLNIDLMHCRDVV